ncbi:MAG: type II toxin-antitoxin system VapC family toxin [Coleofasciculus sp. C1-SOL-03]|uniref:type II toxin-antitoxin system VapC family toxin n=1 Tax=Coleofasciculus sp. C1-SOL-03 TaxID=3069522 RepID=UPI0032FB1B8A
MSPSPCAVLDASALLAYLQGEPGSDRLAEILVQGAVISAINWAETLSKLAERGQDPDTIVTQLIDLGVLNNALSIYSVDEELARDIAKLRPLTRSLGLSLGDRACLALALKLNLPALTTDRIWENLNLSVQVQVIR